MNNKYDISVVILTYNPDLIKLKRTILSILIQEGIKVQIVIADDGSAKFYKNDIIDFLEKYNFSDFTILIANDNAGTVINANNAIKLCKADYVKFISPGDFLYNKHTLLSWLDFTKKNKADLSFCNAVYYTLKYGAFHPIKTESHPQKSKKYYRNQWYYDYLIFDDIVLGACVLSKTDLTEKYLSLVVGSVKYAEDNIYRIMAGDKLYMAYYDKDSILYEYGSGVSTSDDDIWGQRLQKDWKATDEIIRDRIKDKKLSREFIIKTKYSYNTSLFLRIYAKIYLRGSILFKLKSRLFPNYTNITIDSDCIIYKLLEIQ